MQTTHSSIRGIATVMAALVFTAAPAKAAIALTSNSAGGLVGLPFSLGYVFTVTTNQSVTALGQFDVAGDGVAAAAKVALFNWDTGSKIFETSLTGAVLEETGYYDTHFVTIAPVALIAGTRYLLATEVNSADFTYGNGLMSFDPVMSWVEGRATGVGAPAMPATADGTTFGIVAPFESYFGPNLKVVPEPTSFALLCTGGFITCLRRRRG